MVGGARSVRRELTFCVMADVAMLKQAVFALYAPTSTDTARSEANAWLMTFAASPAAWEAARTLLTEADEQVQYFGANLLFMKVRSEWHGLPEDAKAQIYGVVKELVGKIPASAPGGWMKLGAASKRLCLVLAAAAVRSSALESFASDALKLASDPSGKGAAVAVELLIALPQELLERHSAQAQAPAGATPATLPGAPALKRVGSNDGGLLEGRPELRALLPQVLQLLVAALEAFGTGSSPEQLECAAACLRCLQQWCSLEMGYSLVMLMDSFPALLQCAMGALASTNEALSVAAADALVDLLTPMNTSLTPQVERQVAIAHLVAEQLQGLAVTLGVPEAAAADDGAMNERQYAPRARPRHGRPRHGRSHAHLLTHASSPPPPPPPLAHRYHFCRVLCAFAERAVDVVATTDGRMLPLVQASGPLRSPSPRASPPPPPRASFPALPFPRSLVAHRTSMSSSRRSRSMASRAAAALRVPRRRAPRGRPHRRLLERHPGYTPRLAPPAARPGEHLPSSHLSSHELPRARLISCDLPRLARPAALRGVAGARAPQVHAARRVHHVGGGDRLPLDPSDSY